MSAAIIVRRGSSAIVYRMPTFSRRLDLCTWTPLSEQTRRRNYLGKVESFEPVGHSEAGLFQSPELQHL